MKTALLILQMVSGVLLALTILVQEKGSGLGEAIAGSAGSQIQTKKRGVEKIMATVTVVFFVAFVLLSLALNFI